MCLSSFFYEVTELSAANTTILWSVVRRRKSHPGKEKARERLCGLEQSAGALDGRAWGKEVLRVERPPGSAKQVDGEAVCLMRVRQAMRTYG